MRYLALACDYDGTVARHGRVDDATLAALERLLASGRKLLLVTGRELDDLARTFSAFHFFEWIVAENGALLYHPASKQEKVLGERPPPAFVDHLRQRGVTPLSLGRVIVATWHPHETVVLDTIRDLGLELQVIFNKDAVMVLPAGVNKAKGLAAALKEMKLSPHNVVGVGDAENDHAFLALCECSAAVDNALPMVKERADLVLRGDHGKGVTELIEELVASDLRALEGRLTRHHLLLGTRADGTPVGLKPYGSNVLIAGSSGAGKSTLATGLLERLAEAKYQFCAIDPEGDYATLDIAVVLGTPQQAPPVDEVLQLMEKPGENAVVNLVGLRFADRPAYFLTLLARLQDLRARTGRPHWILVDEAHHVLAAARHTAEPVLPRGLDGMLFITVKPSMVAAGALGAVDTVVAAGEGPADTLRDFCTVVGAGAPDLPDVNLESGEVLVWQPRTGAPPFRMSVAPSHSERRRHRRKYAEGELPPHRSFYFRGPDGKLNLRAQNLMLFLQLAEGVDDRTWLYHLHRGDYARWFREHIKDEHLAAETEQIQGRRDLSAAESRALIRNAVEAEYTLPSSAPSVPAPANA
jgi:HAD superfamily hydrolase (TIGR01484 family)